MAKGIIVVDVPENCKRCQFHYPARDMHTGEYMGGCRMMTSLAIRDKNAKPDWCPIKPMPDKKDIRNAESFTSLGWIEGWNACLNKILK